MKKVLILGKNDTREGYDSQELFKTKLSPLLENIDQTYATFDELEFWCDTNDVTVRAGGKDLRHFDLIFFYGWFKLWKDVCLATATYANKHGVAFFNTEALHQRSSGKVSQAVAFAQNGILIPKTTFNANVNDDFLDKMVSYVGGFPLIAKQYNGNKGSNNFLIKSRTELLKTVKSMQEIGVNLIFQEYIPNDGDMRVYVVDGKIESILLRRAKDTSTHLHNTSLGAEGIFLEVSEIPNEVAEKLALLASIMHREFSGIDLVRSTATGQYYALESNNMPQIVSSKYSEKHVKVLADCIRNRLAAH